MLAVRFTVNGGAVLEQARTLPIQQYNSLLQDYVCACALRIARDMFALLPLRHIIVDAEDQNTDILSVDFEKKRFINIDFSAVDASDTVQSFRNAMDFSIDNGFSAITPLDI